MEFVSGVVLRESPVHCFAIEIAHVRPRQHGPTEELERRDASIQTLLRQRRALDCCPLEP